MDGFIEAWQPGLLWVCLCALGAMAALLFLAKVAAPAWDAVRRWWSLPCIQRILVGVCVVGLSYYGATKQGWHVGYDGGIKAGATANVVTNDTVAIYWQRDTSGGVYVPETATVYIDYRPNTETNAEWGTLAQTTVGAWGWSGTVENATNYDYNVWAYYIPPEPVHTNGVWTYKTHFDRNGEYALPLRARVEVNGVAIATPAEKRKDAERVTAKSYIQDGLIAMWDGIENAGWGTHDPNATVWKDLVGDNDITLVGGVFGDTALICNGTQYGGYNDNVVNAVHIEIVANAKQYKKRCWIASTGQSLSNRYSGFVGWYDRGLCFGLYDTARSLTLGTAISYSFAVNSNRTFENNALVATESGKSDLTPQAQRGICVVVGGQKNNPLMCDIHCIRIYSRALTDEEIAHNYKIDKERFNLP